LHVQRLHFLMTVAWKGGLLLISTCVVSLSIVRALQCVIEVETILNWRCSDWLFRYLRLIFIEPVTSEVLKISCTGVALSCNDSLNVWCDSSLVTRVTLSVKWSINGVRDSRLGSLLRYELICLNLGSLDLLGRWWHLFSSLCQLSHDVWSADCS
jgi:hypothetical protein